MGSLTKQEVQRPDAAPIKAVPVRHPGRWIAALVLLVLLAMLVNFLAISRVESAGKEVTRFGWGVVGNFVFAHSILTGLVLTIELTLGAMVMGIVGGTILAVMRMSPNPLLNGVSWLYIWFFRGTPLLVQLLFWGNLSYLFTAGSGGISFGIPFGPDWGHFSANTVVPLVLAGFLGLGLNEAAYMSEIVRAGILAVDEGQSEAASALGMSRGLLMRRVVLPQAMRVIVPPTGNEVNNMLKNTSLVSIIALTELLYSTELIYAANYEVIPLLIVACLWYLLCTSVWTVAQFYIERYFARGSSRQQPPTPMQRIRTLFRSHPDFPTRHGLPTLGADQPHRAVEL